MLTNSYDIGMISVINVASKRLTSADYAILSAARQAALKQGRSAVLVNLQAVRRITQSGLAALLEFQSEGTGHQVVGFYGAQPSVHKAIKKAGLLSLLTIFDTQAAALSAPLFCACRLAGVKSVLLVAGTGSRMAPINRDLPKPMLDVFGQPIIAHLMQHMQRFGLRDFILNPGHLGEAFHRYFGSSAQRSVQFANEGQHVNGTWQAAPLGSAASLFAIQARSAAFDTDFFVLCGDALTDIDLAAMMEQHRRRDADVTIAVQSVALEDVQKFGIVDADATGRIRQFVEKPAPEKAPSQLASTGIYIFNPSIFKEGIKRQLPDQSADIACDLLPALLRAGARLDVYEDRFQWVDVGCVKDYYSALSRGLRGLLPCVAPDGAQPRRQLWCTPGALVSPRAVIVGPCYIGAGAVIETGAKIEGPSVILEGARVSRRALVRRSVLMPNTCVKPGAWVDDMIASGDWAVDHRFAQGQNPSFAPIEGVERIISPVAEPRIAKAGASL
jgi:mannose-1-phosphate guanylyltransferase